MIFDTILDIIYPQNLNCIICGMPISRNNRYSICKKCYEKLIFINRGCERCGKPVINLSAEEDVHDNGCRNCCKKSYIFERNISVMEYTEESKKMIFSFKYNMKTYMGKIIAEIMADFFRERYDGILDDFDFILYVPLSRKRMKKRGFNQAGIIAKYFGRHMGMDVIDGLLRIRNTEKLFRMGSRSRKRELLNSFRIKDEVKSHVEGKNIIIIDDIFTTGATLNEISKILKIQGAEKIMGITFLTRGQ